LLGHQHPPGSTEEMNSRDVQGAASQTILGNITPTISPIESIVKSARIVQSSNVVLKNYYVTISDEKLYKRSF
jgi:hypothetical protein